MSPRLHSFLVRRTIVVAAVLFTLGVNDSAAQSFDVRDFRDTSGMSYVGTRPAPSLELTESPIGRPVAGAIWRRVPVPIAGTWTTSIAFQIIDTGGAADPSGRGGADGLAFVIQTEGPSAIGGTGYNLGYGGIQGGLAVEVDTWDDSDEPVWGDATEDVADHVAIHANPGGEFMSAVPTFSAAYLSRVVGDVSDGYVHTLVVRYSPGRLAVFLDDCATPVLSVALWLDQWLGADSATIGITAATQSAWQRHRLHSWCFTMTGAGCGCEREPCDTLVIRDTIVVTDTVPRWDTLLIESTPRVDTIRVVERDTVTLRDTIEKRDTLFETRLHTDTITVEVKVHDTTVVRIRDTVHHVLADSIFIRHVDTCFVVVRTDTCLGIVIDSAVCGYATRAFRWSDSIALRIAPNPARDAVTLDISAPGPWSVVISAADGTVVSRVDGDGPARVVADVSALAAGIYFARLFSGDEGRDGAFVVRR